MIQTNVQVALADPNPEAEFQRSQLETIERITRRLGKLIEDLLFLARHDGGITNPKYEVCNLAQILHEVCEEQQAFAQQKDIKIEFTNVPENLLLAGDAHQLGRLFTNLISNAIAYTSEQGQVIITIKPITSQNQVQVQIKDTGIGIPEAELSQIFERFYRYQPQKNSKSMAKSANLSTSGSGLGLAIAKAIANNHQGQINVESKVSQGTTFIVNLPNGNS